MFLKIIDLPFFLLQLHQDNFSIDINLKQNAIYFHYFILLNLIEEIKQY